MSAKGFPEDIHFVYLKPDIISWSSKNFSHKNNFTFLLDFFGPVLAIHLLYSVFH